jgi:uncharacterized membrane protein YfcA
MDVTFGTFLVVCPLTFLAGFIDSIAGGGGLISLPSYFFAGLPVHFAYGTNKFSSTLGTIFSTARFMCSKQVDYKSSIPAAFAAVLGSAIGARAALTLDDKYLKYCLVAVLPAVLVFVLTKRGFGENSRAVSHSKGRLILLSTLAGFAVGMYDGFLGPGTGTFLIFIYTSLIGFDLKMASGNAKIVNLASNASAAVTFIIGGKVLFLLAMPAALFGILGNWLGSGLAIKNGAKIIKPVLALVTVLLLLKIGMDLFG